MAIRLAATLLLAILSVAFSSDVMLELKGDNSCTGVSTEGENIDILCTMPTDKCVNLSTTSISWIFASTTARVEIGENDKYGIWGNELSSDSGILSSVLRVRDAGKDKDAGTYTCRLSCRTNSEPVMSRKLEICIKDDATDMISCSPSTTEDSCTHVFANGKCEENCNTEEQLFDGGDCDSYRDEVCSTHDCLTRYDNGVCDKNCSSSECGYDGGDCLQMAQSITREKLSIIIPTAYNTDSHIKPLSRQISILLGTLVKRHGEATLWSATDSKGIQTTYLNPAVFKIAQNNLTMIQFRLIPQSCQADRRCFLRVRSAAKYISQKLIKGSNTINSSIAAIGIDSKVDECPLRAQTMPPSGNNIADGKQEKTIPTGHKPSLAASEIAGIALCVVSIVLLVLGVVVACRYRKIANSREKSRANKQSHVKAYIDSIPADLSSEGGCSTESPKSPQSSIARSVTSKDTIIVRDVINYKTYDSVDSSNA